MKKKIKFERKDVYEMVNEKVLTMMQEKTFAWVKTWKGSISGDWNYNYNSKHQYSWLNNFMLDYDRHINGFESQAWLTFNGVKELGGSVAGQKSKSFVVFFTMLEKKDKDGNITDRIPYLKYTPVFNADQVSGVEFEKVEPVAVEENDSTADIMIQDYLKREGIEIKFGGDSACYSPSLDRIKMPLRKDFKTDANYYATLFHECVHSTGSDKRLKRIETTHFGTEEYSKEELVAEIGSSYLCALHGYFNAVAENSVAYLQGWMSKIKENKYWLVSAFGKAEKAVALITNDKGAENGNV